MRISKATKKNFDEDERIFRAARFCQSLASVLTIPLTSMVCSCAMVGFLQKRTKQGWRSLTLRQSMTLADKGWTDPVTITKLVSGGWKRYGSVFLIFALILNLIGASISPLQGIFITNKSVKVPNGMSSMDLVDIWKWVAYSAEKRGVDVFRSTTQLRSRLMSTGTSDPQFRLWTRDAGCNNSSNGNDKACAKYGQSTFASMYNTTESFWAQPPVGFQTGLWKQVAPRINFTTLHEKISPQDFPTDCQNKPDALYMHYANMTEIGGYLVDICMPGNQTKSPWKATRQRQDFVEELYIKATLDWDFEPIDKQSPPPWTPGNYSFKITLNTTAGYFELPNYHNNQRPGPLLDDPGKYLEKGCGAQCEYQTLESLDFDRKRSLEETSSKETEKAVGDIVDKLSNLVSKGPLLSITLALFTQGSYLDIRHTVPGAYQSWARDEVGWGCVDIPPLIKLLHGEGDETISGDLDPCVSGFLTRSMEAVKTVMSYIYLFTGEGRHLGAAAGTSPSAKRIQDAFNAAAFIATDLWIQEAITGWLGPTEGTLNWDLGVDQQVPDISNAGMILISTLLGVYLFCILGLSLYVAWTPRWTNQLDSFAMMRIGSAAPGRFPLRLAHNPDEVRDLDELPGWIGGTAEVERHNTGHVYNLGLGGEESLKMKRRYHCYVEQQHSDH
ncbi:unnamed protein product [Penicillium salamii]|nr:unnamed protein product [Penicillium salamii]